MRIVITGATGLIGRNLLFEIIKQNLNRLDDIEIIVLGRNKDGTNIGSRIRNIVLNDGLYYISPTESQRTIIEEYSKTQIKAIYADLDKDKLSLKQDDFNKLKSSPIDAFFHLAALTDLRYTPGVGEALEKTNVYGTQKILDLVSSLAVKKFFYTGTAYSCGNTTGNVKPNYINSGNKFRNPYERTKLQAEILVRKFSKKTKSKCMYFRPSVTCGRLMELPIGAVSKFDVFYGWAAFFLQIKLKNLKKEHDIYKSLVKLELKIRYNMNSGLNIVPADYAAKVMYQVSMRGDPGESYHLVNNKETPHNLYVPLMLKALNIKGPRQTNNIPKEMNYWERLYYKTAGRSFTPYTISDPMLFDVSNLSNILRNANLKCPPVDVRTFPLLMEYAKAYDFGMNIQNETKN